MDGLCVECNVDLDLNGEKTFSLLCKEHFICRRCLTKRARDQPNEVMVCARRHAQGHSPEESLKQPDSDTSLCDGGIWIFVDDSTIWLEAKRLQSTRKGYLTSEDHRLRIDMRKLESLIASDRRVKKGILYAAEPPPIYEVWRNSEKKGWDVEVSELKQEQDKQVATSIMEKKINAKLVAKATAMAILTPPNKRTTMVFVTGDAHVVPALKEAVKNMWEIEIYMWRDAISKDIHTFADKYPNNVKICHLDEHLESICFFRYELDIHLKEMGTNIKEWLRRRQPMYCGAVLSIEPGAFAKRSLTTAWISELEMITKWPFQYYWFLNADNTKTNNLVITFKTDSVAGRFNLPEFLQCDSTKTLPHVRSVEPYHGFIGKEYEDDRDKSMELEKIDKALGECNIQFSNRSSPDASIASDSDTSSVGIAAGFQSSSKKKKRSKQLYSTPCKFGKNCKYGTSCYSNHSKEEKDYFKNRIGGKGNPRRKTTLCQKFLNKRCPKSKQECERAHGEEDAFCPSCICVGHLQQNCPNKATSPKNR